MKGSCTQMASSTSDSPTWTFPDLTKNIVFDLVQKSKMEGVPILRIGKGLAGLNLPSASQDEGIKMPLLPLLEDSALSKSQGAHCFLT